jgi:hypothetical protein
MDNMNFKKWMMLEFKDIFGFETEYQQRLKRPNDDVATVPFIRPESILTELSRINMGVKRPVWDFHDTIIWGTTPGAIRIDFSPLGSYKILFRKLIEDLEGAPIWICKHVLPLTEDDNQLTETEVMDVSENILKEMDLQGLDSASRNYEDMQDLVVNLAADVRRYAPEIFIFEGVKKLADDTFLIHLGVRGQGVEAPSGKRIEQFNINVHYSKSKGLIRSWGCDVSSPTAGHKWELNPSEWDECFTPSQPPEEIILAIVNCLRTY